MQDALILREANRLRNEVVGNAIRKFGNWLKTYRRARSSRYELSTFSADEVATLARDSGARPSQLRALSEAGAGAAEMLNRMFAALGIDPRTLKTMDIRVARELQATCSLCASKSRCRRSLSAGKAATEYWKFCPNAATLGALTA
jgi:hypothetical protein